MKLKIKLTDVVLGIAFTTTIANAYAAGLNRQETKPGNYLDQVPPPSDRPVIFAEGIVSVKGRWEEKISFTVDGKEMFFGVHPDDDYFRPSLMYAKHDGAKWSAPTEAAFTKGKASAWPMLSPTGKKLFMEQKGVKIT